MEICPNCCEELKEKSYNRRKKLKCFSCGYETSTLELEEEGKEFLERMKSKHYNQNTEI